MLNKLFDKKHKEIQTGSSKMEFFGELEGNGVNTLRFELGKVLKKIPYIENAYFSKLKYKDEESPRISLLIESSKLSEEVGAEVAGKCSGVIPMDIIFSDTCPSDLLQKIKTQTNPLFNSNNLLFDCPLVVSRGTNRDMPSDWKGAVLNYYVAAEDYKSALFKAADALKLEGYKYENILDDKVHQLNPSVWWVEHVMGKWKEYSDHFPSQEDIEVIVITGGLYRGPVLGWENEHNNT